MNNKILEMASSNKKLFRLICCLYNYLPFRNKLCAKGVKLSAGITVLNGLKIKSTGVSNQIFISDFVQMDGCAINIYGSNNKIFINEHTGLKDIEFYFEDDNNEISVGKYTNLCGRAQLAVIEGTKIRIGDNCLFSSDVYLRTGDSHSILDKDGKRINPSRNIEIGNRVWIGTKVMCLKGVSIADDCIVAATATLNKAYSQKNCIIAGVPAKVIKTDVSWQTERI